MKKSILIFLSVIFCTSTPAQNNNPLPQFKVEHWDSKKGLPNDLILTIHQSKDGFLWMTSYNGLTRFDGVNFTAFNSRNVPEMKTDKVNIILETEDSTLWFPTESSGLLAYKNGVFKSYLKKFYNLRFLAQSKNNELLFYTGDINDRLIFFNIQSNTYKSLDSATVDHYFKDGTLFSKNRVDRSGYQWRRDAAGNPVIYGRGKMQVLSLKEGIIPDTRYFELYVDKKDRVWLTTSKGLFIWNGHSVVPYPGMQQPFQYFGDYPGGLITEDHKGGIWVRNAEGVAYLQPGAARFIFLPQNYFTNAQNIKNIIEDKEGNIWIASETGVLKLSYSKFVNYSKEEGLINNRVSAVTMVDSTRCLVASMGKFFWIENGVVHPYQAKNPALANLGSEIYFLYQDSKQNIWACGTSTFKITATGEQLIKSNGQLRFAYEDAQKKMWFAIPYSGIGFLNNKDEIELLKFPAIDFKTLFISSIRKLANGNWLVTTYNKGMLLIDNEGKPTFFSDIPGLPTIVVFKSYEDADGTIWLTTSMGISRYKNGTMSNISFKDGLPENSLFDFLPDHKGYVWFPSAAGLVRAKKQELTDYLDKKINRINWQLFNDGDGMRNRQCVGSRYSAITPNGKILVPTFGGLVEIDPERLTKNTLAPNVIIHRVLRNDSTINLKANNIFEPGNHRYIFEYSGLSMVAPEKVQFKFKLIGYDKDWITAIGERKAFYTNIPAGKYTFQVIASNNDGVWNETGANFSFTVKPFFYDTNWFRILIAVGLLFLVWIVIRWRTQATRKQNEILEAQVAARTQALHAERNSLEKTLVELKTTQSQLIQSEKMASLGELTAGIAHEIQNPLNFVNNFSEVNKELIDELQQELKTGKIDDAIAISNDIRDNEEKINHHGKRADAIVKGMLQHSRSSSGVKEPTDINALCDEYLRLSFHGLRAKDKSFNATMKTDFDESIEKINIIPQDIGRVILNLLTNAFYVVDEKKTLRQAQGDSHYEPTVSISTKKVDYKVEISVIDNGNGIPKNIVDKIFQPFFTTKPTGQGTGLGLSLSYDIVKAHGGELKVETKENEGSEFLIQLPVN